MNKHDCKLYYLEVIEDEEGYFYVKNRFSFQLQMQNLSAIEYCPVCGTKANKSHISNMTMYNRKIHEMERKNDKME